MKLSKKCEYALRALVFLAAHPGALHTIPKISQAQEIPPKFLEQILLSLRQAGLLNSRRGAGGGYALNRAPAQIRVLEVVKTMDADFFHSLRHADVTNPVDIFLFSLEKQLLARLEETTVEDLLVMGREEAPASFDI